MRRRFAIGGALLALSIFASCKPRAGGACEHEGAESCLADSRALACHEGRWEEVPCRGFGACSMTGKSNRCDQGHARAGDACNPRDDMTCSENDAALLQCIGYRWVQRASCDGPKRCQRNAAEVTCDDTAARAAEPCLREGAVTCSGTGKAALICRGGAFSIIAACKGLNGCRIEGERVHCDDAEADAKDPCSAPEDREHFACSTSHREVLRCEKGLFAVARTCPEKTSCSVDEKGAGCSP